jgi:FtsH-binding integral membrane protein
MELDRSQTAAQRSAKARDVHYDPGLRAFFRDIYNMMTGGLVTTGIVAWFVSHSPAVMHMLFGNQIVALIVMLAPVGFSLALNSMSVMRMRTGTAVGLFFLFSAVLGLSLSTIFVVYTGTSIARVFFITAIMFAGMSIYGYTTKRDLTGMGSLMIMGAWGVFISLIVNAFLHSDTLGFAVSVIGVIVYTGLIGWNTQTLRIAYRSNAPADINRKIAMIGALQLYISFVNLFMMLLRLTGSRR